MTTGQRVGRGRFSGAASDVYEMGDETCFIRSSTSCSGPSGESLYQRPMHKICVTLSGGARSTEAWIDGERVYRGRDSPGSVTIIPAGALREGRFQVVAIALHDAELRRMAERDDADRGGYEIAPANNVRHKRFFALGAALHDWMRAGPHPTPLLKDAVAAHVANLLLGPSLRGRSRASAHGLHPRALGRTIAFIDAHLAEDLTLQALAAQAGLGDFAFLRAFAASTGVTPHQFVLRARVERAKAMLAQSQTPIATIACRLGFSSHSHLSAAFRRVVGASPSAFRRGGDGASRF